jgi:hypothetical protein
MPVRYVLAPFSDIVKLQAKKNFVSTYNKVVKQYAEEKRNLAVRETEMTKVPSSYKQFSLSLSLSLTHTCHIPSHLFSLVVFVTATIFLT